MKLKFGPGIEPNAAVTALAASKLAAVWYHIQWGLLNSDDAHRSFLPPGASNGRGRDQVLPYRLRPPFALSAPRPGPLRSNRFEACIHPSLAIR